MKLFISIILFLTTAFVLPPGKKIKIWLIGDSTMAVKEIKAYPETGWGMPFLYFWDSTVTVDNRAMNGRSTRTFIEEKRWDPVVSEMQEGDYVLIQFGHNDEVPTKKTYTTETQYKDNLTKFVKETREKKAIPLLLTPVARRKFTTDGKIEGTHDVYAQIVRDVAAAEHVLFIDLDKKSQELYQQFGVEQSKLLFVQLKPGEHPNYPDGKEDNTHFSELGARLIAQLVLKELRALNIELSERIVGSVIKK